MNKSIIRYSIIPFGIISIFGSFFTVGTILYEISHLDKYVNNNIYKKLTVKVDSLEYSSVDGNAASIYGYVIIHSNKTEIIYGNENDNFFENSKVSNTELKRIDNNDTKYHYIWYRQGHPKAYPALPNETRFPVWQRLNNELRLTYFWLFCLIMTIILWKIGVKMGFMKNKINEE